MTKFSFSPGLPGYGSQGVDGSAGTQGLGIYFSAYAGTSESVTINNRIVNNLDLTAAAAALPEDREYQTGDLFIDTAGKVFNIDLDGGLTYNRYAYTGAELASSTEFDSFGPTSNTSFNRYVNDWQTLKKIYDQVYSTNNVNYTATPDELYVNKLNDYSSVHFSDYDVQTNGYYPYQAWVAGTEDESAIALVRESASNIWHLGNLDGANVQRDIALNLDFNLVKVPDGSIAVSGFGSNIVFQDTTTSAGEHKIGIETPVYTTGLITADLKIEGQSGPDAGAAGSEVANNGGRLYLNAGNGANFTTDYGTSKSGGNGGDVSINGGQGGYSEDTGAFAYPGDGGDITIFGGNAGYNSSGDNLAPNQALGGSVKIYGGFGGDTSALTAKAGYGGDIEIFGGISGYRRGASGQVRDSSTMGGLHLRAGEDSAGDNLTSDPAGILIEAATSGANDERGDIVIIGNDVSIQSNDVIIDASNFVLDADVSISLSAPLINITSPAILLGHDTGLNQVFMKALLFDFSTGFSSKIRNISDTEGVVVGTGTATALEILNNSSSVAPLGVRNANTGAGAEAVMIQAGPTTASASYHDTIIYEDNGGTARAVIQFNNVTGAFAAASDENLKGNIVNTNKDGLSIINNIPVRDFQYKVRDASGLPTDELENYTSLGFIAQEVLPHFPEMVDQPNAESKFPFMRIRQAQLIPIQHKAIQQLSTENNDLKTRVTQLESLVSQLIAVVDPSIS